MSEKIEKLKKKIKTKPKLYKTLKVVKVLCNVGAYLIALFTILSLSIGGACSNSEHELLAYGDYKKHSPKQALTTDSNQYLFSSHHLINDSGFSYLYYLNEGFWTTPTANDYFAFNVNENARCVLIPYNSIDIHDNFVFTEASAYFFNAIQFQFTGSFNYGLNNCFLVKSYRLRLFNTEVQTNTDWLYTFDILTNQPTSTGSQPRGSVVNISSITPGFNYGILLSKNINPTMFNYLNVDSQVYASEWVKHGYVNGYEAGYNEGYQSGNTGTSNNPFNLIRNAFDAVASFLDIQILPGLNIGVLLFAPLIITIIIVLVKMFRG